MNALTQLKHGLEEVWESLSEGWNHIHRRGLRERKLNIVLARDPKLALAPIDIGVTCDQ